MRLGAKRHIHIRTSHMSKGKVSVLLLLIFFLLLFLGSGLYFLKIVRPLMIELAKNQAMVMAEQAIHRAVNRLFSDADFSQLVTISRLEDGTVSSIASNMSRINKLKAEASLAINEEIAATQETSFFIPLGTLTGYDLLAGVGPRIPVSLMPYGRVIVEFEYDLTESGINQTLLAVNLKSTATIGIVLPGGNVTREVSSRLPVTQTVIVGKIPDNYVNIGQLGENYESDVLDIVG